MAVRLDEATLSRLGPAARAAIAAATAPAHSGPRASDAPRIDGPALSRRLLASLQSVAEAQDADAQTLAVVALMREVAAVGSVLARA